MFFFFVQKHPEFSEVKEELSVQVSVVVVGARLRVGPVSHDAQRTRVEVLECQVLQLAFGSLEAHAGYEHDCTIPSAIITPSPETMQESSLSPNGRFKDFWKLYVVSNIR